MTTRASTSKKRQITICKKSFARAHNRYVYFPEIYLRGKWLKDSGFKTGHIVDVACEEGKLVITLSKEQRWVGY